MFNTPLGKKLYENMLGLGYHMMSGKAALYTNVVAMVTDFVDRKDGKIYFSKKMTYADLEKLIVYLNDYTDYRCDIKLNPESKEKIHLSEIFNEHMIKFDEFDSHNTKGIKLNEYENKFAFWNDVHHNKLTVVINTGVSTQSVLNIDVVIVL